MYAASSTFVKKLNIDNGNIPVSKITINVSSYQPAMDISRFVSKFGSISRSMEYDTGKFSPGRHTFDVANTNEFGSYLFTTRNRVGIEDMPGTNYWTDLPYNIYYGFSDSVNMASTGLQDELICLYQGVINSKTEDRVEERVQVSSNDVIKKLVETKLATKDTIIDDLFDYADSAATNKEQVQKEIRYGKHLLNVAPEQSILTKMCTIGYSSTAGSVAVWFTTPHKLNQWDYITVSNSVTPEWDGTYVVSSVYSETIACVWSANLGANSICDVTRYIWHPDRLSLDNPSTCIIGIPIPYVGTRKAITTSAKYNITDILQRAGYPNTLYAFCMGSTFDVTGLTDYIIKDSAPDYNAHSANFAVGSQIDSFEPHKIDDVIISAVTDNGDGRVVVGTVLPYGHATGDHVFISGTTDYNGDWEITVRNTSSFYITATYTSSQTGLAQFYSTTETSITFSDSDIPVFNHLWLFSDGGSGKVKVYTQVNHGLANGDRVVIFDTTDYNGEFIVSGITYALPSIFYITKTYQQHETSGHMIKSPFPIRIYNGTSGYNGNHLLYLLTTTTGYIDTAYIDDQQSPKNYFDLRNAITITADVVGTTTGTLYLTTLDIGGTWYFPFYNTATQSNYGGLYYWDYVAKIWCLLPDENAPTYYGATTVTDANGFYMYMRNDGRVSNSGQERKFDTYGTWWDYMQGTGSYWGLANAEPLVCMCSNTNHVIDTEYVKNNPISIVYDVLINHVGIPTTYLDKGDFSSLAPTTYSWDKAANYFLNSGDWDTGGSISVVVKNEISAMDLCQSILSVVGVMMLNSFITSSDKRLKLIINEDYTHGTSVIAATYSTNNCLNNLVIDTDNDKIKDRILMANYAPQPTNLKYLLITKGTGSRPFSISQDLWPNVYWYDSNFWADRCATNYYNKLSDAWEDVKITVDMRGVLVDLGDYIQIYDHKVSEYIVIQVYSYSFNLDTSQTTLSGKKVFSNKDVV